jgi:hypothetical protein
MKIAIHPALPEEATVLTEIAFVLTHKQLFGIFNDRKTKCLSFR